MRVHEVVALNALRSQVNDPGEFVLAAVTDAGFLVQRSGNDPKIATVVLTLIEQMNRDEDDQA